MTREQIAQTINEAMASKYGDGFASSEGVEKVVETATAISGSVNEDGVAMLPIATIFELFMQLMALLKSDLPLVLEIIRKIFPAS